MLAGKLTVPDIMLIAGTRVALGIGIGLLISGRLGRDQRRGAGLALTLVGAITTIPLVMRIIGQSESEREIPRAA